MKISDAKDVARDRILYVAAGMFAEGGYRDTSIRKICDRAEVNVSMVNYYFRSKEELYLSVIEFAQNAEKQDSFEDIVASNSPHSAEEQLRLVIERLMFRILMPERSSLFMRLVAWELVEPSPAIAFIAENEVRQQHKFFGRLIRNIVGNEMSQEDVRACVLSIIGQAIFYSHSRPIHEIAIPELTYDVEGIRRIASNVYRFSIAAIRGMAKNEEECRKAGIN